MRKNYYGALLVALCISTLAGCQTMSGWTSRLAWWKNDAAASDTSIVARSASPILPSQQATPTTTTASTPPTPSYAASPTPSYSTTSTPASTGMGGSPAYAYGATSASASSSYPATSTGYPTASYPTSYPTSPTASPAGTMPQSPTIASTSAPYAATPMTSANTQPGYAQQGAYDASGYQAMTAQGTPAQMEPPGGTANSQTPASTDRYAGASIPASDRYGMSPTSYSAQAPSQPAASNSYTYGASQATASPINAATASALPDRYGAASNSIASSASASPSQTTTPPGAWPGSTPYVADASASPGFVSTGTEIVRLSAPTGQYRPAGTSNYPAANTQYGQVNVAARPDAPMAPATNASGAPVPQAAYPYNSANTGSQYGTY